MFRFGTTFGSIIFFPRPETRFTGPDTTNGRLIKSRTDQIYKKKLRWFFPLTSIIIIKSVGSRCCSKAEQIHSEIGFFRSRISFELISSHCRVLFGMRSMRRRESVKCGPRKSGPLNAIPLLSPCYKCRLKLTKTAGHRTKLHIYSLKKTSRFILLLGNIIFPITK